MKKKNQSSEESNELSFLLLQKRMCKNCLFTDKKLVSDERKEQLIEEALKEDSKFICHLSKSACCRGFFEKYQNDSLLLRLAKMWNLIKEVDIKSDKTFISYRDQKNTK